MGKELNKRIPNANSVRGQEGDKTVKLYDAGEKAKHKQYADKRYRAQDREMNVGDQVLVKTNQDYNSPTLKPKAV